MNPIDWIKNRLSRPDGEAPRSTNAPKIPRVSDYLSAQNIAILPGGPSKQQVLGKLIGSMDLADPGQALKAILSREEAGSTIIAPGIALPHARLPRLSKIHAALGISQAGVIDPKLSREPVYIFLVFVAPAENMREHLAFLASVSALLQAHGLLDALLKSNTPQEVLSQIRHSEAALS